MTQINPSDEEIQSLVSEIRLTNPTIGLQKLLTTIKAQEPSWSLSEKRLKKLLSKRLVYTSSSTATSRPTPNLSIPSTLIVRTSLSGKGLYAAQSIEKGTTLFLEKTLIWVPHVEVFRAIQRGESCAFCGKVFGPLGQSLRVHCKQCNYVWCSKTCSRKDEPHSAEHKLLTCPRNNPSWNTFLRFVVETENWHGGLAMGYLWSRMVCFAGQSAGDIGGSSLFAEIVGSFSTVSQEKRHENLPSWMFEEEIVRRMWTEGHRLLLSALKLHPSFSRIEKFLTLDQFLLHLGMFNTNNLNGALYPLHTHINHSCRPNAKAVDTKNKLSEVRGNPTPPSFPFGPSHPFYYPFLHSPPVVSSRLWTTYCALLMIVTSKEDIAEMQEITISYVDPDWPGKLRRQTLKRDYGFDCSCDKCKEEMERENLEDKKQVSQDDSPNGQ